MAMKPRDQISKIHMEISITFNLDSIRREEPDAMRTPYEVLTFTRLLAPAKCFNLTALRWIWILVIRGLRECLRSAVAVHSRLRAATLPLMVLIVVSKMLKII